MFFQTDADVSFWEERERETKGRGEKKTERGMNIKKKRKKDVSMSDIKTEVIVNGSWHASCDICFQGIDEDTSSVRVLLLYCLWESTGGHVHVHLLTLDLFYVVQVLVIVNCCMLLIYMHRQTFTTYSFFFPSVFFPVQLMTEKLSEILMCATIDRSYYSCSFFFQVFIWQAMRQ